MEDLDILEHEMKNKKFNSNSNMVILTKNINLKANLEKYTTGLNTARDGIYFDKIVE